MDFGDASDLPFPTLLVNDGARHRVVPGIRLGALIDFEPDGQPNATATGDGPDDDGVTFLSPVLVGQVASVSITASTNGLLSAWLDFNRNGSWADAGEQIFTNAPLVPGPNLLVFNVPLAASPGAAQARFRFGTAGGLSFTGEAADGEVEDYRVVIGAAVDLTLTPLAPTAPVVVGSNVLFTLVVTNVGPSTATGVTLSNALPAGLSFVSAVSTQGACNHAGGTITCALGSLSSNVFAAVTIEVLVTGDGSLPNAAFVSATESDIRPTNNAAQIIVRAFFLPAITTQPSNRTVTEGAAASFAVTADGTALGYQWRQDGVALPGATNATLSIPVTSTNHAGSYRVLVTNEVGSVLSSAATLNVLVPATILVHPQELDRVVGDTATFTVSALGTAPLTYQWVLRGFDMPGETSATLTLLNVQPENAGLYAVRVENLLRSVTSGEARLTVFVPPAFTAQPQGRTNFARGSVRHGAVVAPVVLQCRADRRADPRRAHPDQRPEIAVRGVHARGHEPGRCGHERGGDAHGDRSRFRRRSRGTRLSDAACLQRSLAPNRSWRATGRGHRLRAGWPAGRRRAGRRPGRHGRRRRRRLRHAALSRS
jgi:uncharacterized repeat protein (TIGR01451 family)